MLQGAGGGGGGAGRTQKVILKSFAFTHANKLYAAQ